MTAPGAAGRRAVWLLGAQAFALGLAVAWTAIAASTIFLDTYGSGALPATYVGAAVAGALATWGLTRAFRARSLVWVAKRVLAAFAALLAVSFLVLRGSGEWMSALLLVLVPILVPVGFVFVVGQAGMLLDVRAMKSAYARVVAGYCLGFVVGGVAGPSLLSALGRTEGLLACAGVVAVAFLWLVHRTERSFPGALSEIDGGDGRADGPVMARPTMRSLLRDRYVMLIAAFQFLSAIESQWLDYLVYDRALQRYPVAQDLADFISRFTAIAYGADILFLVVFAGLLLRRVGLGYGLTVNAGAVLAFLVATVAAAAAGGSATTLVFVLVGACRVCDITLSDGASRTSLGAAYQAVPAARRLAAQSMVEGLAVPVAIGLSGAILIIVRQTVGTSGVALQVMTAVVVVAWLAVAVATFRHYRVNLLENLRYRTLDSAALDVGEASTLAAIDRLVASTDEHDVRLGLDLLASVEHPTLADQLHGLAADSRLGVRMLALERLAAVDQPRAAESARAGLGHDDPLVRAASTRALSIAGGVGDLAAVAPLWDDVDVDVRLAVAAAIARLGDEAAQRRLAADIAAQAIVDPAFAARALAATASARWVDRAPLEALLRHADSAVVELAIEAIRSPDDAALLVTLVPMLDQRRVAGLVVDALARCGDHALALIDDGLSRRLEISPRAQESLVRACRLIGGDAAVAVLARHLDHADRDVGHAALRALAHLAPVAGVEAAVAAALRTDLEHAARVLHASCALPDSPAFDALRGALGDELALAERRVLASLSIRYGVESVGRVAFQLAQNDPRAHALALEWLEVTLAGDDRAVVALLDPTLSPEARLRALARWYPLHQHALPDIVRDLVEDPDDRWRRPWITACALVAATDLADAGSALLVDRSPSPAERRGHDALIVAETATAIARRLDPLAFGLAD